MLTTQHKVKLILYFYYKGSKDKRSSIYIACYNRTEIIIHVLGGDSSTDIGYPHLFMLVKHDPFSRLTHILYLNQQFLTYIEKIPFCFQINENISH